MSRSEDVARMVMQIGPADLASYLRSRDWHQAVADKTGRGIWWVGVKGRRDVLAPVDPSREEYVGDMDACISELAEIEDRWWQDVAKDIASLT